MTAIPVEAPRPIARAMLIVALGILVFVMLGMVGLTLGFMGGRGTDWGSFYSAGTIVRLGDADQLYDSSMQAATQERLFGPSEHENAFPLPAFFAFALAPLTVLPFSATYALWFVVNLSILAGLLYAARRYLADMPPFERRIYLIAAAVSTPVAAALAQGQLDFLVLSSMLGCMALLSRDQKVAAGLVLSVAVVKPHFVFAPLLLLVLNREWRTVAAFSVVAAALLAFPLLLSSPGIIADQMDLLFSYSSSASEHSVNARMMVNLRGTLTTIDGSAGVLIWGPPMLLTAVAALALAVRRWLDLPATHAQAWALALTLPIIYSPHVHFHSLIMVLAAATLWVRARSDAGAVPQPTRVVMCHLVVTMLWLLSSASIGLLSIAVLAAFATFYAAWPGVSARLIHRDRVAAEHTAPATRLGGLSTT